jgi:hypothetical protein
MLVWIVFDEDKSQVLAVFDSRDKGLSYIAEHNGANDCLCLISEIVK